MCVFHTFATSLSWQDCLHIYVYNFEIDLWYLFYKNWSVAVAIWSRIDQLPVTLKVL